MAVHASGAAGKAKMLRLSSFAVARGMRTGMFRSFFRGRGIEFDSVRQYQYGDDVRAIDWNVSARTGKTYVKTFAEERDMALFLVLDASLSMHTGTGRKTRLDQALESAALLAFAAEQLPCPVGGVVFGGETGTFRRPAEGPDNVLSLPRHKKRGRRTSSCPSPPYICGGYLLSHSRSTIGVIGLNCSVRYG